jgi:hypothetical protein
MNRIFWQEPDPNALHAASPTSRRWRSTLLAPPICLTTSRLSVSVPPRSTRKRKVERIDPIRSMGVRRGVGHFLLSVLNATLVEGEVFGVTQRQPEKASLHALQFTIHPQVDAFEG